MARASRTEYDEISNGCNIIGTLQRPLVSDFLSIFGYDLPIFVTQCTGPGAFHFSSEEQAIICESNDLAREEWNKSDCQKKRS